ncbi:MAG TPA: hypothetical protein VG942_14780 [Hyphomonadaceae bacterium]|nr:hypothetical protein [Hyphomonadaceae bacterium]
MRILIACASALLLTAACGTSQNAVAALKAMNLEEPATSKTIAYKSKSGSGDKVTLSDVRLGESVAPGDAMLAKTVELSGLDITKDGKPIVKSIVFKGLSPEKPEAGSKVSIDSMGIEGMNPATGQFVAAMISDPNSTASPPAFADWQFSKISLNGLTVAANMGQSAADGAFNVQLGEFSISDLKNTVFGSAKLAGFKGNFDVKDDKEPVKGTFDLGTTEFKNIRGGIYASIAEAMFMSMFNPGGGADLSDSIAKALTSPLEPGFDSFTSSGMNFEASGIKLAVSKIDEKATRDGNGVVTALNVPKATITFSANSAGGVLGQQTAMGLSAAGYPSTTIELYAGGSATFDPAKDLTRYTNYQFGVTDGLDMQMSAGVSGLHKAIPQMIGGLTTSMMQMLPALMAMEDPQAGPDGKSMPNMDAAAAGMMLSVMGSMMEVKITDLDVSLTDKSLVGYLIAQSAKEAGRPADAYRQDLANMISGSAQDMSKDMDPALAKELTTALAAFVKGPGTLHIVLKPKTPLGLDAFMGSTTPITKDSLGLSATFTPGAGK